MKMITKYLLKTYSKNNQKYTLKIKISKDTFICNISKEK